MTNVSAVVGCDAGVSTTITVVIAGVCSDGHTVVSATEMRTMVVSTTG